MMRVISAPEGLKWASVAVFLTVPIAAIQAVVLARAPWWALPLKSMEFAGSWSVAASVVMALLLLRAWRGAYGVLVGLGSVWVVLSAMAAIRTRNPGMGFFTIFLGVYFGLVTSWVKHEFSRSFFDPSMRWFEGAPRSIPALDCDIVAGEDKKPFKVSRLDGEGTFLFGSSAAWGIRKARTELVFRFRGREVHCRAVPMLLFKRSSEGVGFRFEGNTPDQEKELGDFIETLRGEGYV